MIVRLASDERPRPHNLDDDRADPPSFDDDLDLIAEVVMPGGCIGKRRRPHSTDCSFDAAQEQVLEELCRGRLRASGRKNGEGSREVIQQHEWPGLRFYWGRPLPETHCYLPPAVSRRRWYVGPSNHHLHVNVPYWTDLLLEREKVVALRPDPVRALLRALTGPMTLAEAVTLLIRERAATKDVWRRLRRRNRGRFPAVIQQRIEDAGKELIGMLRKGEIAAKGRLCHRDEGIEAKDRQPIDDDFLDESLWVDPCADGIWTEPDLRDGRFNPMDRGYRDVSLKRAPFCETLGAQSNLLHPVAEPTPQATHSAVYVWYREEWVPQRQSARTIPTREQEELAARERFGPGHREVVRDARKKYAPPEWTKTGPKQLNRKISNKFAPIPDD